MGEEQTEQKEQALVSLDEQGNMMTVEVEVSFAGHGVRNPARSLQKYLDAMLLKRVESTN